MSILASFLFHSRAYFSAKNVNKFIFTTAQGRAPTTCQIISWFLAINYAP